MKIGALDVNWWNLPLEKRLQRISELGFEGVQLWLALREVGFSESVIITEWPLEYKVKREYLTPRKLAKLVEESGLDAQSLGQFNVLGPQPFPVGPTRVVNGEEKEERIKEIKGLMDFAAEAGVKIIVCDSGGDPEKPEQWPILLEFMNELVDYAEKVDVILAMENTSQNLVADDDALLRLMKEIPSKSLKVHFDPSNLNSCPPGNKDIPGAIRKLKGYIVSAHAKDSVYVGGPGWKHPYSEHPLRRNPPKLGEGTTPWRECIRALKEIEYDGYLIVEYFAPWRTIPPEGIENVMVHGKKFLEKLIIEVDRGV